MTRDVLVIGGGPAGCAAAIGLAKRGLDVVLVEGKAFPRAKVCGEFVSPAATGVLESLLPTHRLAQLGAQRVRTFVIEEGQREVEWSMPAPGWVLSRRTLDDALLGEARALGVDVRQPARVACVEYPEDPDASVRARVGDHEIGARVVIHADGKGLHDPASSTPMRGGVVGMKCHLDNARARIQGLRMRSARDAYIGSVGVEGGGATVALVARNALVKAHKGDGDALLASLWDVYDPAWRTSDWLSSGVAASRYTMPGDRRSLRAGNAAAAVEPVGGEGIGLALWSGDLVARMLELDDLVRTQRSVRRAYQARVRWRIPACRVAAETLMRPSFVRTVWPMLRVPACSIKPWYALTGKPLSD